ncbi:MAG: hypothetical protein A2126_00820 [Candidatus Woykebacteria bacterium GWB1_45_5]|uniref:Uncharacterized protein n=1 Tax=Candidatus Woykebacteria bacterium GWB1_45_5 TaxID=1802592 RepID=A0A1G1WAV5_9BACT|nr:MAG: hypothetical protein A2126_00820 [Candidatus Woykebacteria bacterium GWB1_45_5]
MRNRILLLVSGIGVVVILGLVFSGRFNKNSDSILPVQNQTSSPLETLISNEGGVEVAVTPVNIPDSSRWAFEISLTTHSVELSEDLVKVTKLVLDSGEILIPLNWKGDSPGGHHRNGVLVFSEDFSLSGAVLKILEVGGVPEREFAWNLK